MQPSCLGRPGLKREDIGVRQVKACRIRIVGQVRRFSVEPDQFLFR